MTERALVDRLDQTIDAILSRGDATASLRDPELAPLARIAADLRHCPGAAFKARLRTTLERSTAMSSTIATTQIREGFTTITPYLRTRTPGLVEFLSRVFGAAETMSTVGSAGGMHREIRIGNSMLMLGEGGPEGVIPFRPAELHVYVDDVDAAFQRALAAGATSLGEPANRPYGERAGFVRDMFGNHWFIATHLGGTAVPQGLRTMTPFLHAPQAAQYIEFLKRAFGAKEESRHDGPQGSVIHAMLRIGNAALELGEAGELGASMPSAFYLYVDDADAVHERAIAAGATVLSRPADQPYGERMGGVTDVMGNQWFIATPL